MTLYISGKQSRSRRFVPPSTGLMLHIFVSSPHNRAKHFGSTADTLIKSARLSQENRFIILTSVRCRYHFLYRNARLCSWNKSIPMSFAVIYLPPFTRKTICLYNINTFFENDAQILYVSTVKYCKIYRYAFIIAVIAVKSITLFIIFILFFRCAL